jgi:PPOX class probable F420-dependent enzyme
MRAAIMRGMTGEPILSAAERAFVSDARRATLATIDPAGLPRLVPICFVLDPLEPVLWTPLDEKPKATDDPLALARVRDILERAAVSVLVDRWDEDWSRLGWLRIHGRAALISPGDAGHGAATVELRAKYAQYAAHALETRPMLAITLDRVSSWGTLEP